MPNIASVLKPVFYSSTIFLDVTPYSMDVRTTFS
jgi:hypothetical protein